jgi:hypothetical protein
MHSKSFIISIMNRSKKRLCTRKKSAPDISHLIMLSSIIPISVSSPHSRRQKHRSQKCMHSFILHPHLKQSPLIHIHFLVSHTLTDDLSQNLLQFPLLFESQTRRKLHIISNHKITPRIRLLAQRHAQVRIAVFATRLCGACFLDVYLLAVDSGYSTFPSRKRFFEFEINGMVDVVSVAGEEWMFFL